ncbi:sugar ABC transporter substrate-binding protein [Actinoplanes sp. NBRC 14428]|uniref:D-xylose transport system substrate-binding protein n=1 Tax=Pseudosporangium ferrugineum TaxID=439699 RepID=A0A2T0SD52_9ACTN|nr:substrate-binding domain-containing protein [Pseudosporangium ferrugineum]PRY31336.1 D-xylose transport system substrate-binding protein [Pseudosporangium ferrugineum]BCJ54523.1 sugar ABC transporter substrate-binding protein [Actinoplanes sp. NBRC 14428]
MRTKMAACAAVGLMALSAVSACTDDDGGTGSSSGGKARGGGAGKVGVILPDTTTSQRWGTDDPKLLKAAFDEAGVPVDIQNAEGDKAQFQRIADSMIAGGVRVLMIVNLDSATGKVVLDKARAADIKTIDYDRLTLNGAADYYVSFDNEAVGVLQGNGLVQCLKDKDYPTPLVADLNGSPTDNNATLFKQGYDSVLQPLYDSGEYLKGPDQSVTDWDNDEAGVVFGEMWAQTGKKINGVVAANDGLGNAAISVLKKDGMNGKVPVTGQDATVQGLQNILAGDQCMTVYKPIKQEADAAAALAIKLFRGEQAKAGDQVKDPESGGYVPAVLLKPLPIFKKDVGSVIADGFVERKAVCAGRFAPLCEENDIN